MNSIYVIQGTLFQEIYQSYFNVLERENIVINKHRFPFVGEYKYILISIMKSISLLSAILKKLLLRINCNQFCKG